MPKIGIAGTGQFSYTEAGGTPARFSEKIVNCRWLKVVNGSNIQLFVVSINTNSAFISFSNITGAPDFNNTLNGVSSISGIETEILNAFNDAGGGGGGSVVVTSSALPTGAATEATLSAILAALGGGGSPHVLATASVNASGNVTAGKYSVLFEFSSNFTGTLDGVAYNGADFQSKAITAEDGRTLPAINYTVTAGTMIITTLT